MNKFIKLAEILVVIMLLTLQCFWIFCNNSQGKTICSTETLEVIFTDFYIEFKKEFDWFSSEVLHYVSNKDIFSILSFSGFIITLSELALAIYYIIKRPLSFLFFLFKTLIAAVIIAMGILYLFGNYIDKDLMQQKIEKIIEKLIENYSHVFQYN